MICNMRAVMRQVIALVFLLVSGLAAAAEPCQERQILGAWESSDGNGFFEQFELSRSTTAHTFNSWLHERPDLVDASWELRGCVLTITPKRNALPPFIYVISVRHGKLLLRETGERLPASYSRIKSGR